VQFGPAYPTISNWSTGASAMLRRAEGILYSNILKAREQLLFGALRDCGGMNCHPTFRY